MDRDTMVEVHGEYVMVLSSVGNPDLGQFAPMSEPAAVKGKTLAAMVRTAEEYRDFWDLGGGNWVDPEIRTSHGHRIGRISYNGRVWGMDGSEIKVP